MILLIDNYDSFTFNLYQYLSEEGAEVTVRRNDKVTIQEIELLNPEAIVISPGPKLPEDAGICIEVIQHFYKQIPIFGICLGLQSIAVALGAELRPAKTIMHGKTSVIHHSGKEIFATLPKSIEVMRYHSYVMDTIPGDIEVTATSLDDQEIMAIRHKDYPVFGVQFHPESIGTDTGKQMIRNFLNEVRNVRSLA